MNIFTHDSIAQRYEQYYESETGKAIDQIEKETILNFLEKIPRQPMLELGCGTGHWTEFFSESGFQVTATDVSDAMLSIAKSKKNDKVIFQKADAANLPFLDHSFTLVATITMLEFIYERAKVFHEVYRVLRPFGWLLVASLNATSELGKTKDKHETLKHANFLTAEELAGHLSLFGTPRIKQCVYLSPSFEILDGTPERQSVEGAFIAGCVQKVK